MISGVVNKMQALIANADLIKKLDMWETITEEQIRACKWSTCGRRLVGRA